MTRTKPRPTLKLLSGQFTLDDFVKKQIDLIGKMGNLKGVMDRMPGMGELADSGQALDEKILSRFKAMIQSMTPGERQDPGLINASRRQTHCARFRSRTRGGR